MTEYKEYRSNISVFALDALRIIIISFCQNKSNNKLATN